MYIYIYIYCIYIYVVGFLFQTNMVFFWGNNDDQPPDFRSSQLERRGGAAPHSWLNAQ